MVKLRNWNLTENCFLITYHPSFMGALVGAGSLWPSKGHKYIRQKLIIFFWPCGTDPRCHILGQNFKRVWCSLEEPPLSRVCKRCGNRPTQFHMWFPIGKEVLSDNNSRHPYMTKNMGLWGGGVINYVT
jgi:hypothetical protein